MIFTSSFYNLKQNYFFALYFESILLLAFRQTNINNVPVSLKKKGSGSTSRTTF